MSETPQMTGAKCRTCGRNLNVEEFRACGGVGHYCATHLPAHAADTKPLKSRTRKPRVKAAATGSKRGRSVSAAGANEYSCKGQFARNGVIRRGRLSSDHPACPPGGVVFVHNDIGYGPGEIVTLYIKDPDGRRLAERTGFECRD